MERVHILGTRGPPIGSTRFWAWLAAIADGLGVEWASGLGRHYR
jgi:hypothetical protein